MSSVGTVTRTAVRTETLHAAKTAYAMQAVLEELGLAREAAAYDWEDVEEAMLVWLTERSLKEVDLEVANRSGRVVGVFHVSFDYSTGEAKIRHDAETSRLAARKVAAAASGTLSWRLIMRHFGAHTAVPGWSRTTLGDRSSLTRRPIGELARAGSITSQMGVSI